MADAIAAPAPVDETKVGDQATRPADTPTASAVAEVEPAEGGDVAPTGEAADASKPSTSEKQSSSDEPTATDAKGDTTMAEDTAEPSTTTTATNGTPASSKKDTRRKSGAGIPEHKKKTPSKKKKAAPEMHLNAQPGQHWFVAMKGYPPWPVVICDEEMLPETLLGKRPVSAQRVDGTYREDFRDGGKNAKDRRYPIMFLGTNEFAWQVNTDLIPFDIDDVKRDVEAGNQNKKSKLLWDAFQIAAEEHDLEWFKDMLKSHEEAILADAEQKEAKKLEKTEKKAAKEKRKSAAAADEDEDVEMEDAEGEGTASAKKSKKRKKSAESEGESEKPTKTPKVKLTQKPKEASATKSKKESKPKKSKDKSGSEEGESAKPEEKPLTEEQQREKREKSVLYLRHRLQKGFLSRDQAPKEEEMQQMSEHLRQLEAHQDLEEPVIKKTKVNKVLKAIIKLQSIPQEETYQFKKRSNDLLNHWNRALATAEAKTKAEATTNGVKHEDEDKKDGSSEVKVEASAPPDAPKAPDGDGDVAMGDAKDETPAPKADDAAASTEAAADAVAA
ncbi:hypothetical protein BDV96DRAFT_488929 [Lophiotrema nucula]|uniref:PWWP domain-containing protein n=1 Tax=Lophiotrema nucula TaxID=690887 RepID=A0A6A5ZHB1_9PLEO|nr:hypothetical protein BDV96DRAFT_488929 [Lophiotrema nucula]